MNLDEFLGKVQAIGTRRRAEMLARESRPPTLPRTLAKQ